MSVDRERIVRTFEVTITREDFDGNPDREMHVRRLIVLREDTRQDEGLEKRIFMAEMEMVWDQLHRFIRRMEVGEE